MRSAPNFNTSLFLTNFCNNYHKNILTCNTFDQNFTDNLNLVVLNENQEAESPPVLIPTNESQYDYDGALYYVCFVLLWYALCVICMIKIQTKTSDLDYFDENGDSETEKAHNLMKRLRNDSVRKEALEELIKPGFRDRMWNIYTDTPNSYKIRKMENKKIIGIDRRLKSYNYPNGNAKYGDLNPSERQISNKENTFSLLKDLNKLENGSYNNTSHCNTINSSITVDNWTNSIESSQQNRRKSLLNMNFEAPKNLNRFHVEKIKEF